MSVPDSVTLHVASGDYSAGIDYKLISMVIHAGTSPHSGHYYSADVATEWLLNDSRTSPLAPSFVSTLARKFPQDTPYVLFYARVDRDLPIPSMEQMDPALLAAVESDNAAALRQSSSRTPEPSLGGPRPRYDGSRRGGGGGCGGGPGIEGPRYVM